MNWASLTENFKLVCFPCVSLQCCSLSHLLNEYEQGKLSKGAKLLTNKERHRRNNNQNLYHNTEKQINVQNTGKKSAI